jgi:glucose/mannose-6-phosphate isomerase
MNISDLEKIDSRSMFRTYDKWPEIAVESFENKFEKCEIDEVDNIVFAGMGGSGSIGDTISAILSKKDIHVSNVKGYLLPKTVDEKTLVIVTSVSGNTIESLEVLENAKNTKANVVSFSSGGKMEQFCKKNDMFFQKIPMIHSPRSSYTSFLYSILNILEPILPIKQNDIHESISMLKKTRDNISSENIGQENNSLNLAKFIGECVSIYYPAGLQAAAIRYKNSLQENTKIHAMAEDVIESCHNGVVAWERKSNVTPILLRGKDDYFRTIERWDILEDFFRSKSIEYHVVNSLEGSILSKIVNLIYLLDYSTIYASVLNKRDPSPVESIDFIKSRL